MQMKNSTFLLFLNMATLLCSNQSKNASIAQDQDIFLNESRKALLEQAFNSVKPQEKTCPDAYAAFDSIVKKKDTDKVFQTLRGLYSDDESFFKALAEKAQTGGFHGLAALMYHKGSLKTCTKYCSRSFKGQIAGVFFLFGIIIKWMF